MEIHQKVKSKLLNLFAERQFDPKWIGIFINPFFLARRGLWREIKAHRKKMHGRLLDVGCGRKPYRSLFSVTEYVGLDIDSPIARARGVADYFYDGKQFPFDDCSFDCVLCNQVLEHVFNPDEFLAEVRRVLKQGGCFLLTAPFVWDEHEQPYDFARYTSFGLKALLERNGFAVTRQRKTLDDASVIFQLIIAYLYKVTHVNNKFFQLIFRLFLFAPISFVGLLVGWISPRNQDLYLDQIVIAERV